MKKLTLINLIIFLLLFSLQSMAQSNDQVYLIVINQDIDQGIATILERGIREAEQANAKALILDIDTYGGLVVSATRMRDAIFASTIPVYTFVSGRAWSAGALIALAGDELIMAPGSSIGAAETVPDDEKVLSAFRAEFRATAERRGRDGEIAMAMVDKDIAIEDLIESGKLLSLSAQESLEYGMSDYILPTVRSILTEKGLEGAQLVRVEARLIENFARGVTGPWLSGLLLTLGMAGLLLEVISPGWGVPGTIGLLSLASFFSGHLLTGTSNWSVVILFVVGLILIAMELFVVPGFGITGLGGILAIIGSIVLVFPTTAMALQVVSASLVATVIIILFSLRYIPKSNFWQRISLAASETVELGYVALKDRKSLVGKRGEALTSCRPAGTVIIEGERIDAVSEGGFIDRGATVEVVQVESSRLVVREVKE